MYSKESNPNRKEPYIIKFATKKGNTYIYDICSNLVFLATDVLIDILSLYMKYGRQEIIKRIKKKHRNINDVELLKSYSFIDDLVKNYSCFYSPLETVEYDILTKEKYENELANLSNLTLEITQNCNFRCKYCIYSGKYYFHRVHSNRSMTFQIAKNSIDHLISYISSPRRTSTFESIYVGFYGGEPLLNLKLIKTCFEYIKSKSNMIPLGVKYRITTNGSLLNDSTIEFLAKNNFYIDISIDGPEEIQNKHRVFKNGKGSFKKVFQNIKKLKQEYPKYYSDFVSFLVTYSSDLDLSKVNSFFVNENFFDPNKVRINIVNESENKLKKIIRHPKYYEHLAEIEKEYKKQLFKNDFQTISPCARHFFHDQFNKLINDRSYSQVRKIKKFSSTCIPGTTKLFVSSDGKFHICERINQKFPIGDHIKGLEYEKIEKINNDFLYQVTKNCLECPAIHFCSVCYAPAAKNGYLKTDNLCNQIKNSFSDMLAYFFSLLEENPISVSKSA